MKLYVWRGENVLRSYGTGVAFALADSVEQAREMIQRKIWKDWWAGGSEYLKFFDPDDKVYWEEQIAFLSDDPFETQEPYADFQYGSD